MRIRRIECVGSCHYGNEREKVDSLEYWPRDQREYFPPLQDVDEEESLGAGKEIRMLSSVCN